ncbi:MAG: hypothetical protein ACLGG3_07065 [Alphaproteobacteria bacterium]
MKFKLFRAPEGRNGGPADPTDVPRMGGQVLPAAAAARSPGATPPKRP